MATRQSSRRAPARNSKASKRARSRRRRDPFLRQVVSGHEVDVLGLCVIVLGVVTGLGVYLDVAGPLGRGIDGAAGAVFGLGRYVAPIMLVMAGVALVRGVTSDRAGKIAVGTALVSLSFLGFLHLASGPDSWPGRVDGTTTTITDGPITAGISAEITHVDDVRGAGGWVGSSTVQPLRSLAGGWGAGAVLAAVGLVGALLVTGSSLRRFGELVGIGVKPVARGTKSMIDQVTSLARDRQPEEVDDVAPRFGSRRARPVLFDDGEYGDVLDEQIGSEGDEELEVDEEPKTRARKPKAPKGPVFHDNATPGEQLEIDLGPGAQRGPWKLPSLAVLDRTTAQEVDRAEVEHGGRLLEGALAAHGVQTRLVGMTVGPTVTRYELELGPGVKVARVTALNKDIAYSMAALDVRILAPIPGRSAIGIEVPNKSRHLVALGDILTAPEAIQAVHPLEVGVGRDIAGRSVMLNLAATPHMLVAGATGAGKSSFINSLVTSLLMRSTPDQVRLILIDPKRVEMGQYNDLPHLLTQVVTSPKKAANALAWAVKEMERRYDVLHEVGVRDITGYNAAFDRGEIRPEVDDDGKPITNVERLPFIVLVVDELNDLMMVAARDVEESITRIAQMARAVGIHLVIATQRPSVNVITGVIKANIPTRVAFAVSSQTDSKVILDQVGAERLIGKGDMLYLSASSSVSQRIQGAWVSEDEVRKVTAHWKRQMGDGGPTYIDGVEGPPDDGHGGDLGGLVNVTNPDDADDEQLVRLAIDVVVRSQLGSTSMLQRKLKIGFARAGRIMDLLEQRGVVGPSEGSKARAVLMSVEEYESLLRGNAD